MSANSMSPADAEEYTQALGQVVAGGWRQVALGKRLGVPDALGISVEDWVEGRLGGYVRLSIPERREAVAELAAEGMSTRSIGGVLGVDNATVHRDQRAAVADATPAPAVSAPTLASGTVAVAHATEDPLESPDHDVIRRAVARDMGPVRPAPVVDPHQRDWDDALRAANDAAKLVRALPDFPATTDELFRIAALDVAKWLADAAKRISEQVSQPEQPVMRRVK